MTKTDTDTAMTNGQRHTRRQQILEDLLVGARWKATRVQRSQTCLWGVDYGNSDRHARCRMRDCLCECHDTERPGGAS